MRSLVGRIEVKTSEKSQLETRKVKNLLMVEKANWNIKSANKTIFEKVIEIVSFGFIKYNEKYNNNIEINQRLIIESEQEINQINQSIEFIEAEINNLKINLKNKINQFKTKLIGFQNKLISFTNDRYINAYTRMRPLHK